MDLFHHPFFFVQWGTAYNLKTTVFPISFRNYLCAIAVGVSYGLGEEADGAPRIRSLTNNEILCTTGFSSNNPSFYCYFIAIGTA